MMTDAEIAAFEEKIYAFVGQEVCPPTPAKDDVNAAMIRHWCEAMGDTNPAYSDPEWAATTSRGGVIMPPAMLYCWIQEGFPMVTQGRSPDAQSLMVKLFDDHGYFGSLGTNVKQEYFREVGHGDQVVTQMEIDSISERKDTARGVGYFFETLATFTNQRGEKVGTQRFRVLKFIPSQEQAAPAPEQSALEVPTRIGSPRGHDNTWWWEACDEGRVLIQRCSDCQTLRHPPRPMCGECQSMAWDSIESTLAGEVLSFTQIHHPRIPGYQYPLVCAVIRLGEGTNLVSNIVGCEPSEVHIGLRVQGKVEQVDEKTMLPQFYPA